jgi:hypothetical protein
MHESADYPELENVWQSSQLVYGSGRQVSTFTRSEMAVRSAHPHDGFGVDPLRRPLP